MKDHLQYTKKDFEALPLRENNEQVECDILVLLPQKEMHDSGYRCLDLVAIDYVKGPLCRLSGWSDVVHINGIGGYGEFAGFIPQTITPIAWSIDCLPKSGLLCLWAAGQRLICPPAYSSFVVTTRSRK